MLKFVKKFLAKSVSVPPTKPIDSRTFREVSNLAESDEHFSELVAGLSDYAIFLLDRNGYVLTWNAGAERIKGYRSDEIIGQHFSRFYPQDALSSGWPAHELEVAGATGRFEDEGWRVRKDGTKFWANVVITTLREPSGDVRGFLKITRDMTDRRQAEEKLRLSEERFRLLVEGVRDYAIFMLDPQGNVATWNAGAEAIKGYTADEIIGHHFSTFYPQSAIEEDWPSTELKRATELGRFEDEGWRIRKDGTKFWANVVITALQDESGTLRGFAKVTRDMTERHQAEENARRLLKEEVARRVAEESATEAQQAREEERRQREQLHVTLSSIGDAVIVTDRDGNVTFLNPVASDLTGWQLEEAVGQPLEIVFPIINEETRLKVENPVEKVFREKRIVELANHTSVITKDGREIPVEDSAAPIRVTPDGDIVGAVLVFRDVTAARRALEDHLYLSAIVESSHDAIIGNDLNGIVTSWNQGAEKLYGYTAEEIIGESLSILIPAENSDELPSVMKKLSHGERIENFETERVRKDGSRFMVSLTISPITNEYGKVVGASKIARDITSAKRYETGLRFLADASKVMSELLDVRSTFQKVASLAVPNTADWCAVHVLDDTGNPERMAISHIDAERVQLAEDLYERYPPSPDAPTGLWNVLRSGQPELIPHVSDDMLEAAAKSEEHLRILRELGLRSYICIPLKNKQGTFGAITFASAESGRVYSAEDLAMAEDLAHRASIAIENARLYEKVREAHRRKDEFLAMLSHELRNPLAPIRSGLEILSMEPANNRETLQVMQEQVDHVVRLVDDLLDVSRIMQGKIELRKNSCELTELVKRSSDVIRPLLISREQSFQCALPSQPVWLKADPVRLVQVIENLLSNASKYTDVGGRIELFVECDEGQVEIAVSDTGVGIDAELLPQVFELFTQSSRSLDRAQGGLGIGLTLVQRIVEMHGGTVKAHSEGAGKGSTFVVLLPTVPTPDQIEKKSVPSAEIPRRRILVVDDNVGAAKMLLMLLKKLGDHEVEIAHDGNTALAQTEPDKAGFDVVFLDIGLPEMNGYQLCQALRKRPTFQETVIVALTGYGRIEDRQKSHAAGFDEHLVKPPSIDQIKQVLAQARNRP